MGKLNDAAVQAITSIQDGLGVLKEEVKKVDTTKVEEKFDSFVKDVKDLFEDIEPPKDK